jgi:murein L,D-transpeptidase YcbB/YkuD
VDIRKVSIVQPPGPSNALGQVKFLFPNKHDVYMHDTPAKALFNADVRAFSHGCVRVRNPMRFAEIIFSETAGWAPTRVASLARGRPENQVPVGGKIGVHITYFTVVVDDEGKARTFHDIYGHEARVNGGLEGRMAQVARKPQNLNAVRTSLISRAPVRRTAANLDRDGRGARRGGGRAGYQTGGGFFSWLSN